jgi:hypothetical protein
LAIHPIESDKRVRRALTALGWRRGQDGEAWLRRHVRTTIAGWIDGARAQGIEITSPADVPRLAADRLRVSVLEVESDEDLRLRTREYCKRGELAFLEIQEELNGDVEAAIFRLKAPRPGERHLVAVVDARGERGAARFFGSCHEVAHPFLEPQLSFNFRRREGSADPLERAVDMIAGEIAFFEPLARPILAAHAGSNLTYDSVERFWADAGPTSSRTAAFVAAVRMWNEPALLVTATCRCARHGNDGGIPALRVERAIGNGPARDSGLFIPKFRVPPTSPMHRAFHDPQRRVFEDSDDLGMWRSSGGKVLSPRPVRVGARRIGDRVFAIMRDR